MKTNNLFITFILLVVYTCAFAQGENNIWTFGHHLGLDFNGGAPVEYRDTCDSYEGAGSVSDASGKLLFYCDGSKVFDRRHIGMPNGNRMLGHYSTTQGVVIAPKGLEDSLYFIFLLQPHGSKSYLSYSVVDLRLNGGFGDVVTGSKNIIIDSTMSEKMIIAGSCDKQWIIVHHRDSSIFKAFDLSEGIIGGPVISAFGGFDYAYKYSVGEMKISKDNKKIALANFKITLYEKSSIELYDFDYVTGMVSNNELLDDFETTVYGIEFSSNGSKLYVAIDSLYQYELSTGVITSIRASKFSVSPLYYWGMRRGPDDMIYLMPRESFTNYDRIRKPNLSGSLCDHQASFLSPPISRSSGYGFGNNVLALGRDSFFSKKTLFVCEGETEKLVGSGYKKYLWNDGSSDSVKTISSKTERYILYSSTFCSVRVDTFYIVELSTENTYNRLDTTICKPSVFELKGRPGADSVVWSDGSKTDKKSFFESSSGWLRSYYKCSSILDTFNIVFRPLVSSKIPVDTALCFMSSGKISAPAGYTKYLWSGGNQTKDTLLKGPGNITVTASDPEKCILFTGAYKVSFVNFTGPLEDTFTCNEDPMTLDASIDNPDAAYRWNTGETTSSIVVNRPITKYVFITLDRCTLVDTITVKEAFLDVSLGENRNLCEGETLTLESDAADVNYLWSSGETSPAITVSKGGIYRLTISKGNCIGKSEVDVKFYNCDNCIAIPNAFTPNKDGINDNFKPILNCPPSVYQLRIMNRWGQQVFSSSSPNETWDGTSGGQTLESNVYYYILKVRFLAQDGEAKVFKGDVTIIK